MKDVRDLQLDDMAPRKLSHALTRRLHVGVEQPVIGIELLARECRKRCYSHAFVLHTIMRRRVAVFLLSGTSPQPRVTTPTGTQNASTLAAPQCSASGYALLRGSRRGFQRWPQNAAPRCAGARLAL